MATTKIQSGAFPADVINTASIDDLAVTHAKLHTTMDLSSKTVTLPTLNAKLDVVAPSSAEAINIRGRSADDIGQLKFYENDGTTSLARLDSRPTYFEVGSYNELRLSAGGVGNSHMVIDTSGNVGIGTTPKAMQSGFDNIQIGGNLIFNVDSTGAGAGVYMGNNVYRDSTNSRWEYIYTDEASQYVQANGEHMFRQAVSGTADNAITWTTPLKIDSSGNVGIGQTNPGQKLTVAGGVESQAGQGSVNFYATTAGSYSQQNGSGGTAWAYGSTGGNSSPATSASTTFGFHHWNGSAWSNPLNLTTAGNVGIGMTPDASVKLSLSGAIGPTNGTNSAPTHTFYSDPDTGMYRSGANALSFSTGGTERMRVDSSGRVGIGITPRAKLDISQTSNRTSKTGTTRGVLHLQDGDTPANNELTAITFESNSNNASAIIGQSLTNSGSELFFGTSNGYVSGVTNTAMTIDPAGRVGIATGGTVNTNAHPNADDLVIGNTSSRTGMTIVSATNSNGNIHFSDGTSSGNANIKGQVSYEHTDNSFRFYINSSTEALRLGTSGGTVFNNGQDINQNFTVKASGNANALFVDGNGGQVTIGGGSVQLTGGGIISSNGTSDTLILSGANAEHVGAGITLHGNTHSNASQTWFKAGSSTVMTIAGGNVLVGTQATNGTTDFTSKLIAGTFSTKWGTQSNMATNTWTTIFTFGNNEGNFMVSARGSGTGNINDNTTGIIHVQASSQTAYAALLAGSRCQLRMNGLALQCNQTIFTGANINWNIIRIST